MARSKFNSTSRGVRGQAFVLGRDKRVALFPNFPIGSEISYTFNDESLGVVTRHDDINGRLLTNKGGSHNPNEVKVLGKK